jgi:8-oxo-dGTP diphosphatase
VLLVRRSKPPYGWALPGGYVSVGETAEEAARREVMEETGVATEDGATQIHLYSEVDRDPRRHGASQLMAARVNGACAAAAHSGDDAQDVEAFAIDDALAMQLTLGAHEMLVAYAAQPILSTRLC